MNTKEMLCEFASNNLGNAAFIDGFNYVATRDQEGKVFVKDRMGFSIQVQSGTASHIDGMNVWSATIPGDGTYHFRIVK